MVTITAAVEQIVAGSDFAIEGLRSGCLNLNAYAATISRQVEQRTMKPVQKASIVVALARLAKRYHQQNRAEEDFQLRNLVSRSGLAELAYPKTPQIQQTLASLFRRPDVRAAPFFISTVGLSEVSIVTHHELAEALHQELANRSTPILYLADLASLTMQTNPETVDTPRQSYTVIKQLALRDITIVEYITSPGELTIILHGNDLKASFVILHDRFFASQSR